MKARPLWQIDINLLTILCSSVAPHADVAGLLKGELCPNQTVTSAGTKNSDAVACSFGEGEA